MGVGIKVGEDVMVTVGLVAAVDVGVRKGVAVSVGPSFTLGPSK